MLNESEIEADKANDNALKENTFHKSNSLPERNKNSVLRRYFLFTLRK